LIPLGDLVAKAQDQESLPGFVAQLDGEECLVTAVLQRTAVVQPFGDRWADKQVAHLDQLLVDPAAITWRPKPPSPSIGLRDRLNGLLDVRAGRGRSVVAPAPSQSSAGAGR
jgi:hypothetical protein